MCALSANASMNIECGTLFCTILEQKKAPPKKTPPKQDQNSMPPTPTQTTPKFHESDCIKMGVRRATSAFVGTGECGNTPTCMFYICVASGNGRILKSMTPSESARNVPGLLEALLNDVVFNLCVQISHCCTPFSRIFPTSRCFPMAPGTQADTTL